MTEWSAVVAELLVGGRHKAKWANRRKLWQVGTKVGQGSRHHLIPTPPVVKLRFHASYTANEAGCKEEQACVRMKMRQKSQKK
jgi:hypothetical protein